ncbi:hypothetical protein [Nostoc sp.]|uniref:hypothetical protein n=1 Tax=Nostoc sp. TaxID=1180 RepID=UPI003FA556A3
MTTRYLDNQDLEENPASATITVTAVEVPELTQEEQHDRLHLERKLKRAVFEAGKALMELCDRRLYRSTHSTFEEYCRVRRSVS